MKTHNLNNMRVLVRVWALSTSFLLVASAAGFQTKETTDPYFSAPRKTKQTGTNNYSSAGAFDNTPPKSIIRQTPQSTSTGNVLKPIADDLVMTPWNRKLSKAKPGVPKEKMKQSPGPKKGSEPESFAALPSLHDSQANNQFEPVGPKQDAQRYPSTGSFQFEAKSKPDVKPAADVASATETVVDSENPSARQTKTLADDQDFQPGPIKAKSSRSNKTDDIALATPPPIKEIAAGKPLDGASPVTKTNPKQKQDESAVDNQESFEPGRVLALVGGEPIFVGDLLFEANSIIQKIAPNAPDSVIERQRPILIKRLLDKFIDSKLLYVSTVRGLPEQADLEKILEQADSEFDEKALAKLMEQSGVKTTAEFDAHLRLMGSSLRKLRRSWATEQLVRYFLSQQLKVDTEVTHREMLDYYREHNGNYIIPARSKWEQVMVRFDKFSSRDEARKAMVEIGNKIVYGAKLAAVAKESSHGFQADQGGQHDWTSRDALVLKAVDKAIFELPIGELSEIIESRDGYHIIRVSERTEKTKTPFLEAQVEIRKKLEDEKREIAFKDHLKKLKRDIPVEIFDFSPEENIGQTYTLKN